MRSVVLLQFARAMASLALFALAIALPGCGPGVPRIPPLGNDAVVLAFGDSLTYGTGASASSSYPAALERLIGRKVMSAGVPGEVSAQGLARLPVVLDQVRPQLLILCHGGNDLLRSLDTGALAGNLRAMVRVARDRGVPVVLVAVPKPGLFPSAHPVYTELADELDLPIERDALAEILTDNELKSDPIHPNARGYARLAERVAELLKKAQAY
ncbi:MAG: GDSL-type esterase/lipase family protein [Betaproteobacteria bacterium]|jgi:lysophospholipase L1-like esterase|nr:GDSL-type esterase/lipase family protein [Betaproteobacteria bacterium]